MLIMKIKSRIELFRNERDTVTSMIVAEKWECLAGPTEFPPVSDGKFSPLKCRSYKPPSQWKCQQSWMPAAR